MKDRTYRYLEAEPLYPFGFGLTYGAIELCDGEIDGQKAFVTVRNSSSRTLNEVIQVYVNPVDSPDRVKNHSLCGFKPVEVGPDREQRIEVILSDHTYDCVNDEGESVRNASVYEFFIGTSQSDSVSLSLGAGMPLKVICHRLC